MRKAEKNGIFDTIFPILFGFIYYASVLIWIKLDTNLPHWDMGRHLYLTVVYKELWLRVSENLIHLGSVFLNYYYYPPLVHNVGLLFQSLFGFRADVAVASNIIWILVLSISLYSLAKRISGRWAAIASLLILFASPIMIGQLREFQVDLPMTAVFSLGLLLLYRTENFRRKKGSILFGIVVGLGMLVKWSYVFFILPSGLLFLILGLADKKSNKKLILKNLFLSIIFAFIICGGWYLRNNHQLLLDFSQNGIKQAIIEGDPYGFNWPAFSWYLGRIVKNYLFLPLSIIALVGIIYSVKRKNWIPIVLLITYYLIISSLPNKDVRYIMPAIVLLALLASSIACALKSRLGKAMFVSALVIILLVNNAVVAFGKYLSLDNLSLKLGNSQFGIVLAGDGYTSNSPKSEVCPMNRIISFVPVGGSAALVGRNDIDFTNTGIGYFLEKEGRVWAGRSDEDVAGAEYLIYRDTNKLPSRPTMENYTMINSCECIDGSSVRVYQRNKL